MDDGTPTLEVGFAIDTTGSFQSLAQLDSAIDAATANAVAEFAAVERASKSMLDLGGAKAAISSFGSAATREAQTAARELNRVEKAGESLSRQLGRDAAAFGKTKDELRAMKVEAAAAAAEQQGLTELANRLRTQELELFGRKMAAARQARFETEATAEAEQRAAAQLAATKIAEAGAAERAAREHAQLAAAVRGSAAAQEEDARAAERLRMTTDPLYAATSRLNAEIAESTRLYHAGATAPAEYARQQEVLAGRLRDVQQQHSLLNTGMGTVGTTGRLAGHHMQNLAFQFQDLGVQMTMAAQSSAPFKMAIMALIQQGTQIQGIMSQAGIGIRGVGAAFVTMSKSILLATVTNPYLLAFAAAVTVAATAVKLLQNSANDGTDMKAYAASLGLTAKEIRNLDNLTVTYGDTAKAVFQVAGRAIWSAIGPTITSVWDTMKEWIGWIAGGVKSAANFLIGGFVGAFNVIRKNWAMFPAVMGDLFYSAVNASIDAINAMVRAAVAGINTLIAQANKIPLVNLPTLTAAQIGHVKNKNAGAIAEVGASAIAEMDKALGVDYIGAAGAAIRDQARQNARDRIRAQAEKKGYLDPEKDKKPKTDKHAEQLAREAAAMEAQIRNLYALADAYKVSGAAALIAEARVKAESDAIKKRADIEELVDRQIRLAIAQRVVDAAKATAAVRDQANAQEQINAMVTAGLVPAERAADLVKDQIADLPLLAAIEAAQQRGLATEADRATRALADQRAERLRLRDAEEQQRFNSEMKTGSNSLDELREELRLVGATNGERVIMLATLKATQEAEAKFTDPARRAAYIEQQVQIAHETERVAEAQRAYNDALSFTADKWDLIAQNVQNAAGGLADAFGEAGRAIGDIAAIYSDFHAKRERLELQHREKVREAGNDQASIDRANARFALATATSQIGALGDMTSAAKGFFDEKSKGYRALATAEKAFRAIEFALSVRAMVQDAAETASSIAKSGARAAAHAVEAVAKAIASLPFPANLAAGAATAAALAAIGISIAGAFSGGGGKSAEKPNDGTGTVFGDPSAKSESIKRSIDALKEVDTLMLSASRDMAASLRSIDARMGGIAALVLRAGNVDASAGVTEGFKPNAIGSILSKIPLIGGILGGLFGSKATVTASGLYGGSQSLGSILGGGFDASYFSDIEKKKKFLGFTTSTSRTTQFTGASADLEAQFTMMFKSFYDAVSAASVPMGQSLDEVQQRLLGFTFSLGKIDLKGLTGEQIQEKLAAVFGAAADRMATTAFPGLEKFQKVGEGAFETLVRVASTIETVTAALDQMGLGARSLSIEAKMGIADQFENLSELSRVAASYFDTFYTKEEQVAARTAQFTAVFASLDLAMPSTLAGFRQLVEAQDLNTAAGQETYATLLKLAPAFADLVGAMEGARSAADITAERQDLERQLLQLRGDTAALRALELAKLDASNRQLQQQIWAIQDGQEAAKAAEELRKAWVSVGDSITDEVKRIRGLTDAGGGNSFASLMGQFNAANAAARAGDMDAAKSLPGLSQALLTAAAQSATSRQELDRVRAQTAASLEATNAVIAGLTLVTNTNTAGPMSPALQDVSKAKTSGPMLPWLEDAARTQATSAPPPPANDELAVEVRALREEVEGLREDNNRGHAATAGNTGALRRTFENITSASGGDAIQIAAGQ